MSLDSVKFSVNDKPSELRNLVMIQGDTLKFSARIPMTSFSAQTLPIVRLLLIDSLNPAESVQTIGPKNFTVTLNTTLTTADLSLVLAPADTETLILDQNLGQILGISQGDPTWYQPAKKMFLEIQLTGLSVNKTWQGDLTIKGDLFKTNVAGTLPGLT
ncbi:hypothetical protein [Microcoleus sp. Pol12B5]|uniref:hypothetical protein n=1 Tax=Microcoleus sp. Pol12B5 TaxID=3055396 RepID=UPI002FCEE870